MPHAPTKTVPHAAARSDLAVLTLGALAVSLAMIATNARAQEAQQGGPLDADTCLNAAVTAQSPIADCIHQATAPCGQTDPGGESALLCYTNAQEVWGQRITARKAALDAVAPDQIKALAGVELRYDLQMNLLQCERIEALQLVTRERDLTLQNERARCDAMATGLTYAKFFAQSTGVLTKAAQAQSGGPTPPTAPTAPTPPVAPDAPDAPQ